MPFQPTGGHAVGVQDLEYLHHDALDVLDAKNHFSARCFYPCNGKTTWMTFSNPFWLIHANYAYGFAHFVFFSKNTWKHKLFKRILAFGFWLIGSTARIAVHYNAEFSSALKKYPVVLFSHGLAGNRNAYSIMCQELASHGYIVVALEHLDGSASTARVAHGRGWRYYAGLGGEEGQSKKVLYRSQELSTVWDVLKKLGTGGKVPGLMLSGGPASLEQLGACMDLDQLAVIGHSFGGATAAFFAAEHPDLKCGVALDPWWGGLPPGCAALTEWRTSCPLLILGSHDWNIPDPKTGQLICGGARQQQVFKAAQYTREGSGTRGGGSILLVLRGSTHHSFADILLLFEKMMSPLLRMLGIKSHVDPSKMIEMINWSVLYFLKTHMPYPGRLDKTVAPRVLERHITEYRAMFGDLAAILEAHP